MNDRSDHVVVVGGGVIGAMCAWYLQQSGHQVTIVDSDRFGAGCSHGNCGYVCPSHVLPLPGPGAIGSAFKAMLQPNSALKIKPRLSLDFWNWFLRFSQHCNRSDMLFSARARHALLDSSMRLYLDFIEDEGIQCEWESKGLLFVFATKKGFEHYAATNRLLSDELGVQAVSYDTDQLARLEPALKPNLGGAWHYEGDCHLRPDLFMSQLRQRLEGKGVRIVENSAVSEFKSTNSLVQAVITQNAEFEAAQVVVATGAWAPFLNDQLGCRIPIQPGKGYSITGKRPAITPQIPLIFEEHRVAVTPMQSGYRIGSTMEFAGYDTSINRKRLELLKKGAQFYLREPHPQTIDEEWFGWRPMTWDGLPIIDKSPRFSNVWIAAGHNMLGLSMATGTGRLVQELIDEQQPHIDPSPYSFKQKNL